MRVTVCGLLAPPPPAPPSLTRSHPLGLSPYNGDWSSVGWRCDRVTGRPPIHAPTAVGRPPGMAPALPIAGRTQGGARCGHGRSLVVRGARAADDGSLRSSTAQCHTLPVRSRTPTRGACPAHIANCARFPRPSSSCSGTSYLAPELACAVGTQSADEGPSHTATGGSVITAYRSSIRSHCRTSTCEVGCMAVHWNAHQSRPRRARAHDSDG